VPNSSPPGEVDEFVGLSKWRKIVEVCALLWRLHGFIGEFLSKLSSSWRFFDQYVQDMVLLCRVFAQLSRFRSDYSGFLSMRRKAIQTGILVLGTLIVSLESIRGRYRAIIKSELCRSNAMLIYLCQNNAKTAQYCHNYVIVTLLRYVYVTVTPQCFSNVSFMTRYRYSATTMLYLCRNNAAKPHKRRFCSTALPKCLSCAAFTPR
jgi:hypothetical protein